MEEGELRVDLALAVPLERGEVEPALVTERVVEALATHTQALHQVGHAGALVAPRAEHVDGLFEGVGLVEGSGAGHGVGF